MLKSVKYIVGSVLAASLTMGVGYSLDVTAHINMPHGTPGFVGFATGKSLANLPVNGEPCSKAQIKIIGDGQTSHVNTNSGEYFKLYGVFFTKNGLICKKLVQEADYNNCIDGQGKVANPAGHYTVTNTAGPLSCKAQ